MKSLPQTIQRLIREFNRLPGIGSKTSERFVFHLLKQPQSELDALIQGLAELKSVVKTCEQCYTYSEEAKCAICSDKNRNHQLICVVAEPKDVMLFEKTGEFNGLYHVLGGTINHADGVGPQHLNVTELIKRVDANEVSEIILATNPDMEGETTALYISQQLDRRPVTITRLARGLPIGADIEFADEVTLGNAIASRQEIKQNTDN